MTKQLIWASPSVILYRNHPVRNSHRLMTSAWEFPVDRFNATQGYLELDCVNIVESPVYNLNNLAGINWKDRYFSTLDSVADKVYSAAGDRTIYVFYSGGVDSLVVLCALQRHSKYKDFLARGKFKLALNTRSIEEYPSYFYKSLLPEIPLVVANYNKIMLDPDAFIVTGDMGDYIIGTSDTIGMLGNSQNFDLMSDWREIFPILKNETGSKQYLDLCLMAKQIQPFEISSVSQLAWWISQCYGVQFELAKPYAWSSQTDLAGLDNNTKKVFRFFYDSEITTFSYEYMSTNPELRNYEDTRTWPKQYIVNHIKDTGYLTKSKVYSQRLIIRTVNKTQIYKTDTGYGSVFSDERL